MAANKPCALSCEPYRSIQEEHSLTESKTHQHYQSHKINKVTMRKIFSFNGFIEMPSWFIGGVQNVGKMQMLEKWSPLLKELLLIMKGCVE